MCSTDVKGEGAYRILTCPFSPSEVGLVTTPRAERAPKVRVWNSLIRVGRRKADWRQAHRVPASVQESLTIYLTPLIRFLNYKACLFLIKYSLKHVEKLNRLDTTPLLQSLY
jgi:hypothetical protein